MALTTSCSFYCDSFAYASPTVATYLRVSPLTYVSNTFGETFKVDVNVYNVENLHAFGFKLSYNTTLLDVVQVVQGPFFPPPFESSIDKLEVNETKGSVWFSMSLSNSTAPRNGNGTLASITLNCTFAPVLPTKACCVLDLHETILYDNTLTEILHQVTDSLYFWKSMLNDPDGLILDLTTQKGGAGIGEPSPPFTIGEIVRLSALLTFNDVPEENNLVSFEVQDPDNQTVVVRSQFTDNNGVATIEFGIPDLPQNIGTWKAIAISELKGLTAWDILHFSVRRPVGGHLTSIEKNHLPTSRIDVYVFVLSAIIVTFAVARKAIKTRTRKSIGHSRQDGP